MTGVKLSIQKRNKGLFSDFVHKYSLSKTLRFELKPHPETKKHLDHFIEKDTERDKDYRELKKIIDEYHKHYIEESLKKESVLNVEDLKKLQNLNSQISKTDIKDKLKKDRKTLEEILRKQLANCFENKTDLFKEPLIKEILPKWPKKYPKLIEKIEVKTPEGAKEPMTVKKAEEIISKFKKFTTYLTGFHENRKNMYSSKEQGTAISHRIVNENLPKFLSNIKVFEKIKSNHPDLIGQLEDLKSDFKDQLDFLKADSIKDIFEVAFFNKCLTQKGIDNYNSIIGGKTPEKGEKIKGINEKINLYRQKQHKEKQIKISNKNLPVMEELYKQILSDRQSHSFYYEEFENKSDVLKAIDELYKTLWIEKENSKVNKNKNVLQNLKELLTQISNYELNQIYFKSSELNKLSHSLFEGYSIISNSLRNNYDKLESIFTEYQKHKKINKKELKKNLELFKAEMNEALSFQKNKTEETDLEFLEHISDCILESYFDFFRTSSKKKNKEKDFYSLEELNDHIYAYSTKNEDCKTVLDKLEKELKNNSEENIISSWFKHQLESEQNLCFYLDKSSKEKSETKKQDKNSKTQNLLSHIESSYKQIKDLSNRHNQSDNPQSNKEFKKEEISQIKQFLDLLLHTLHLIKFLYLEQDKKKITDLDKDTHFYNKLESLYQKLYPVIRLYNQVRNYIAKNQNSLKKIKINFEKSTLLDGWDINKETANLAVLLSKKENNFLKYYLAVMNQNRSKNANHLFDYHIKEDESPKKIKEKRELKDKIFHNSNNDNFYEKMNYKLLPDPSKMLPKVFFSKKNISFFNPSIEIKKIKEQKSYAKSEGKEFSIKDCHKLIDFYKESLKKHKDWGQFFKFIFSPTNQYKDISDFFNEVEKQGYNLDFDKIKSSYIEDNIKTGKLLLFEIYNKDFSTKAKNRVRSKDNLHTIYFKGLFEESNLKDLVLKLNGKAEVFYRKASKKLKVSHIKNKAIQNKNKDNPKKKSVFKYDLIKDKRFTEDKYFFHVPIALNFKQDSKASNFNQSALSALKDNQNINIIGIDRGERHLAYYTVINQAGEILDQGSFNTIVDSYKDEQGQSQFIKTDYHELLERKEEERDKARKSWNKIENIKELKSGYLSQLVHKLSKLMIEYNAILIFEDLNFGFKRGRMKFEKQVYQKLEKALIDKLNYFVFKDRDYKEPGGFLNAYQLTAPFESFKKMGKQTGFMFYVPAYYTSKVCPSTGFVNLIYPYYNNIKESQKFFKSFENIYFDTNKEYFIFEYRDEKVNPKKASESTNCLWKVCTHGEERYKWRFKVKKFEKYNVTEKLKVLFDKNNIDYKTESNLKADICKIEKADFFRKLLSLLNLTLQLRHVNPDAKTPDEKDFILSPVSDELGQFFDSRKANDKEPKNADANGAYHIALKGLMNLKNLKPDKKLKLKIQSIKNKDWFQFIQKKDFKPKRKKAS